MLVVDTLYYNRRITPSEYPVYIEGRQKKKMSYIVMFLSPHFISRPKQHNYVLNAIYYRPLKNVN